MSSIILTVSLFLIEVGGASRVAGCGRVRGGEGGRSVTCSHEMSDCRCHDNNNITRRDSEHRTRDGASKDGADTEDEESANGTKTGQHTDTPYMEEHNTSHDMSHDYHTCHMTTPTDLQG